MDHADSPKPKPRVVVVGANFAGLTLALGLSRSFAVTVIDPLPHFEFLPNIHELVSEIKTPKDLRLSKKRLLGAAGHQFVREKVTILKPDEATIITESGQAFAFDVCVVALGGQNATFGVKGATSFALPFKSVQDCGTIGEKLKSTVGHKPQPSVVIVGGSFIGIEALGEILRRYRKVPDLTIHLVEQRERLLHDEPAVLDREVRQICKPYPVHFYTSTSVASMTADKVTLSTGEILAADLTIWAGGQKPPPLLAAAGLTAEEGQWAPVLNTLQSRFFDNIFVVGDAAQLPDPLAKQGYFALQMGETGAENVQRYLKGRPLQNFRPSPRPKLISFGDLETYLVQGNSVLASPALAAAKEGVFQYNMANLDRPIRPSLFFNLYERHLNSMLGLALPAMISPFALMRMGKVRVLSD